MSRPILDRRNFMLTTAFAAGLAVAGPAHADGNEPTLTVTGELSYFQRIALPPQAIAFVEIRPAGQTETAPAIAETRIQLAGRQVPIAFSLELPRAHLDDGVSYRLSGGVLIDDQVRWRAESVDLNVSGPRFAAGMLMMVQQQEDEPAAGAQTGQQALAGEWRIVRIGKDTLADDANATLGFGKDEAFSGRLCNSFRGSYTVDGSAISFGQAAATLMACPDPLARLERELFSAFETAATFKLGEDGILTLLDDQGRVLVSARR